MQQGLWQTNMQEAVGKYNIIKEGSSTITLHLGLSIVLQAWTAHAMNCYSHSGRMSALQYDHYPKRAV